MLTNVLRRSQPGPRARHPRLTAELAALFLSVGAITSACAPAATKGTMPPPGADGQVNASLAPDFIAVAGRDGGIAGYAPRSYLLPEPTTTTGRPVEADIPVYGNDLQTLIGHMVAGKGFVPLGVDPATVPKVPVQAGPSIVAGADESASLTMYVRSAAQKTSWFAIAPVGAVGAQGFNAGVGVGCLDVPVGGQLVMVDRSPQDTGARAIRVLYERAKATVQPEIWINIGADGAVTQGLGVPEWWTSGPQSC
jgi:hypothetical protein